MTEKRFNLVLDAKDDAAFAKIVACIRAQGLRVEQELATIGVITGSADEKKRAELEKIPGVLSVEEDRAVGPL